MATIVQNGDFKGAKLLGKLQLAQGKDRVSLTFTLMDKEGWPTTKSINAFAIDPDTARTVMATDVNYHYLMRYGGIMATAFLQAMRMHLAYWYSNNGYFWYHDTKPPLTIVQNILTGLGQVGTALSATVQNNIEYTHPLFR